MKKNIVRLTENQLKQIVNESVKKVLKEGAFGRTQEIWCQLEETLGAQTMLDCIYNWSDSNQIKQWIEWFEEEGYIQRSLLYILKHIQL